MKEECGEEEGEEEGPRRKAVVEGDEKIYCGGELDVYICWLPINLLTLTCSLPFLSHRSKPSQMQGSVTSQSKSHSTLMVQFTCLSNLGN